MFSFWNKEAIIASLSASVAYRRRVSVLITGPLHMMGRLVESLSSGWLGCTANAISKLIQKLFYMHCDVP